jgi:hypothetical protein
MKGMKPMKEVMVSNSFIFPVFIRFMSSCWNFLG